MWSNCNITIVPLYWTISVWKSIMSFFIKNIFHPLSSSAFDQLIALSDLEVFVNEEVRPRSLWMKKINRGCTIGHNRPRTIFIFRESAFPCNTAGSFETRTINNFKIQLLALGLTWKGYKSRDQNIV